MAAPGRHPGTMDPRDGPADARGFYCALFQRLGLGCIHGQVVYQGEDAADWIFLDANQAFEASAGLEQVPGRAVSEVIPGFLETSPGLLATLGRVARSGPPESFETFVQGLGLWFFMQVFSPAPGQFVATCESIAGPEGEEAGSGGGEPLHRTQGPHARTADAARRLDGLLARAMGIAAMREPLAAGPAELEACRHIGRVCREARAVAQTLIPSGPPTPFPRVPAEPPAGLKAAAAPGGTPAPLPVPKQVLLVDDDPDVTFLMSRMLKRSGVLQVAIASGGEAALASLGAGDLPDLVILDLNMPGMSGVQTLGRIRERHPRLPVLVSSGQADIQDWPGLDQPNVAVIGKPFTLGEIQEHLARFAAAGSPAPSFPPKGPASR